MQLTILKTLPEIEALKDEWNQLLTHSASDVPFLRNEFLSQWFRTLGGGEWAGGELYVAAARGEDGGLVGVAPLFLTQNPEGQTVLMFLGSIEISDYLDLIVRPEDAASFLDALLDHLDGPEAPPWQVLDLYNLLDGSPTLEALAAAAQQRGWAYTQEQLQPCPYIPLEGDYETYLAGVKKKYRGEIRRKSRRAAAYDIPVDWYIVEDKDRLDDEIEAFFELMANDHHKEEFLTEAMRTQMRASLHTAFDHGWMQLAFMTVGGKKAAAYLNFIYKDCLWVYNSGLDFSYRELSPGWVLLANLIQWATEQGYHAVDLMRGDERYKYRFGAVERFVNRATVRKGD